MFRALIKPMTRYSTQDIAPAKQTLATFYHQKLKYISTFLHKYTYTRSYKHMYMYV